MSTVIALLGCRRIPKYEDFDAYLNLLGKPTFSITGTPSLNGASTDSGDFCWLLNSLESGSFTGNPWGGGIVKASSGMSRILQHLYPTYAAYTASSGRRMRVVYETQSLSGAGATRNGYTSISSSSVTQRFAITRIEYWDPTLKMPMFALPISNTAPAPLRT